jgi:hypothetical protein
MAFWSYSMLRTDVFKAMLDGMIFFNSEGMLVTSNSKEHTVNDDFRYLMYLSRNNAWVNVAGDLFKFNAFDMQDFTKLRHFAAVCFGEKHHHFPVNDQSALHVLLSKTAVSATVNGFRVDEEQLVSIDANTLVMRQKNWCQDIGSGQQKNLTVLAAPESSFSFVLNTVSNKFRDLNVLMNDQRSMKMEATAKNFDFIFNEKKTPLSAYKQEKKLHILMR